MTDQRDDGTRTRPEPRTEPPEPPPGGPNAISGVGGAAATGGAAQPLPRDLDPDRNPSTDDVMPEDLEAEVQSGEDTDTQATRGEAEPRPEEESPA